MNTKNRIRLSKSTLCDAEKQAVMEVLDREFLGMGSDVQQFEETLTEFFGRPSVCVSTGTAALQLAVQATGIGEGDEVLVQSLTYIASFQAISATGATPVSCEVDPETLCLDWNDAEKKITPKTKAVMPVHYAGGVGALDDIYAFAERHGLRVIEDAAHAFGSMYQGKRVGSFGDIACFSFDGIKNITSGEGGCVVTDDEEIIRKVRDARLLGVELDTDRRFAGGRSWSFDVTSQGWRYHMSNIMAVIGHEQLKRLPKISVERRKLADLYNEHINKDVFSPVYEEGEVVVPHIYVIRMKGFRSRDALREKLLERGIETGVHYQPCHVVSLYEKMSDMTLSTTETIANEIMSLPLQLDMNEEDVLYVIGSLEDCYQECIN